MLKNVLWGFVSVPCTTNLRQFKMNTYQYTITTSKDIKKLRPLKNLKDQN